MKKVFIAGNSVTANLITNYLEEDNRYLVTGYVVDDNFENHNPSLNNCIGLSKFIEDYISSEVYVIMAIGYNDLNKNRERFYKKIKRPWI